MSEIGVATREQIKARMLAIASGDLKPKPDEPRRWYVPEAAAWRIAELENALDSVVMAFDLPGDHCEMANAIAAARQLLQVKE